MFVIEDWCKPAYAYLLGLYLGDGYIAKAGRSLQLRISLDAAYPLICFEARAAMASVVTTSRPLITLRRNQNCVVVISTSRRWPALLPQHGPGPKHTRRIRLTTWQRDITSRHPQPFVRGLIHSDGSRYVARQRVRDRIYTYERYSFSNRSADINEIFREHLDLLDVPWTSPSKDSTQIARRRGVIALDAFIGPKE